MKPTFAPSDVAALMNETPFVMAYEKALLTVLNKFKKFKPIINHTKNSIGGKTDKEMIRDMSLESSDALKKSIDQAVNSESENHLKKVINHFAEENCNILLKNAIDGTNTIEDLDIEVVHDARGRIEKGETTMEDEIKVLKPKLSELINNSKQQKTALSEIHKQRGIKLEKSVADAFAIDSGKDITEPGEFKLFECEEYNLLGKIDRLIIDEEGRIVEIKNPKKKWYNIPSTWDIIQLRCYMRMYGKVSGILIVSFPDKSRQETKIEWDDLEWNSIHSELCLLSKHIAEMSEEDVIILTKKIYGKSVVNRSLPLGGAGGAGGAVDIIATVPYFSDYTIHIPSTYTGGNDLSGIVIKNKKEKPVCSRGTSNNLSWILKNPDSNNPGYQPLYNKNIVGYTQQTLYQRDIRSIYEYLKKSK